jgi:hypothetical protein
MCSELAVDLCRGQEHLGSLLEDFVAKVPHPSAPFWAACCPSQPMCWASLHSKALVPQAKPTRQ